MPIFLGLFPQFGDFPYNGGEWKFTFTVGKKYTLLLRCAEQHKQDSSYLHCIGAGGRHYYVKTEPSAWLDRIEVSLKNVFLVIIIMLII